MNEFGRIDMKEAGIISIDKLPFYWRNKIEKYACPFCGKNKLLKRSNEEYKDYLECIKCGRAYQ